MIAPSPQQALAEASEWLTRRRVEFALVGGLAVSIRGEVRFTRDVDLALALDEQALESLVRDARAAGYTIQAIVEHEVANRTATVRLVSREGINIDLITASSGIEAEIVATSPFVDVPSVGRLRVARAEELLAMKVLSYTDRRIRDFDDAVQLVATNPGLDLAVVRERLQLIAERRYDRGQDLPAKLSKVLERAT